MPKVKKVDEVQSEKPKKESKKSVDLSALVDAQKIKRAQDAVAGKAKGDAEKALVVRFKSEGFSGDALVAEVYKGLGGLVDLAKAAKNRENEKKLAERRTKR